MELLALMLGGGASAALVSGGVQILIWKMNRKSAVADRDAADGKCVRNAIRVLLYDRIKYLGRRHIGNGSITAEDLEDLINMHKVYHDDLDGDGFLDSVVDNVKKLRISG